MKPILRALGGCVFLMLAACQLSPQDRIFRAHDAVLDKKPQLALRQYRLSLDGLEHDDSPAANVVRAQALRGMGDVYYLELRDVRQALATYKELISQCPEAPETLQARIFLANILKFDYHDLRGAIAELNAALDRNPPQGAELKYSVAKLYFALGDYQQAELEAQQLERKYETSAYVDDAMFLEAQSLEMRDGMHQEAAKRFEQLVERFPESELTPHALFELGKLKAEAGDNDAAIAIWVKALKHHPDPGLVQANIARVRRRITDTTPEGLGAKVAFERVKIPKAPAHQARTSVEAAGGTAEEAAHDNGD